jgi:NAD(P)-dependent dehydrogenase (short-subunit alcohol dehydrogenase family)
VAVITGAATGIGRATAVLFAREGARVVFGDVNDVESDETDWRLGALRPHGRPPD